MSGPEDARLAEMVRLVALAVPGTSSCDCGKERPCKYCLFVAEEIVEYLDFHGVRLVQFDGVEEGQ